MKVILLQDVARIGHRYDIAEVPDGHALNYLIPRKMAEPATEQNKKRITALKEKHAASGEQSHSAFVAAVAALKEQPLEISVAANDQGHLFKGVHAEDIASHFTAQGISLYAKQIVLDTPIKELGAHTITLTDGSTTESIVVTIKKEA